MISDRVVCQCLLEFGIDPIDSQFTLDQLLGTEAREKERGHQRRGA